jgi:hypothetical protein
VLASKAAEKAASASNAPRKGITLLISSLLHSILLSAQVLSAPGAARSVHSLTIPVEAMCAKAASVLLVPGGYVSFAAGRPGADGGIRGNFDRIQSPEGPMVNTQREPSPEEIERLAYELWEARGSPCGSSELDWLKAEQILRDRNPSEVSRSEPHPSNVESERRVEVGANRSIPPSTPKIVAVGIAVAVAVVVILFLNRKR